MTSHYTGQDLADLRVRAAGEGWDFATVRSMTEPYKIDHAARCIYVDGRLPVDVWMEAIYTASTQLVGATIIPMPRPLRTGRSRKHTG